MYNTHNYHFQDHHMFPGLNFVETRAQSKDLDPVSVIAEAENRSKTRAYQTDSGDTTNDPLSMPGGRIMTRSMR